jgi:hypothetical protein
MKCSDTCALICYSRLQERIEEISRKLDKAEKTKEDFRRQLVGSVSFSGKNILRWFDYANVSPGAHTLMIGAFRGAGGGAGETPEGAEGEKRGGETWWTDRTKAGSPQVTDTGYRAFIFFLFI